MAAVGKSTKQIFLKAKQFWQILTWHNRAIVSIEFFCTSGSWERRQFINGTTPPFIQMKILLLKSVASDDRHNVANSWNTESSTNILKFKSNYHQAGGDT